jgi:hypothetical protein
MKEANRNVNVGLAGAHTHISVTVFGFKKNRERRYSFMRTAEHPP